MNGGLITTTLVGGSGKKPKLINKYIDQNDIYKAEDEDADGYSVVDVNVQPKIKSLSITSPGKYTLDARNTGYDGYNPVSVSIDLDGYDEGYEDGQDDAWEDAFEYYDTPDETCEYWMHLYIKTESVPGVSDYQACYMDLYKKTALGPWNFVEGHKYLVNGNAIWSYGTKILGFRWKEPPTALLTIKGHNKNKTRMYTTTHDWGMEFASHGLTRDNCTVSNHAPTNTTT